MLSNPTFEMLYNFVGFNPFRYTFCLLSSDCSLQRTNSDQRWK
ncbi:hypothetical protein LINPERHAP1_LOCUS2852 [Linum perenne]